jgi:hypothetical protein
MGLVEPDHVKEHQVGVALCVFPSLTTENEIGNWESGPIELARDCGIQQFYDQKQTTPLVIFQLARAIVSNSYTSPIAYQCQFLQNWALLVGFVDHPFKFSLPVRDYLTHLMYIHIFRLVDPL